jgi:hypothetical protein
MNAKYARRIVEAATMLDMESDLREDYSGRGMYGSKTAAVVFDDNSGLLAAVAYAAGRMAEDAANANEDDETEDYEKFVEELQSLRWDNMGRGIVVY